MEMQQDIDVNLQIAMTALLPLRKDLIDYSGYNVKSKRLILNSNFRHCVAPGELHTALIFWQKSSFISKIKSNLPRHHITIEYLVAVIKRLVKVR